MAEVLHQTTVETLMNVRPEDLVNPNPGAELPKGTARRSSAWVHAPNQIELLTMAQKRLTRLAELKGINKVERVHARLVKGTRLVVLQPAAAVDLTAVPVNRWATSSSAWINLYTLLAPEGIMVETGHKERFEVAFVPVGSPLWPGLVIDLTQPRDRRKTASKKNTSQAQTPVT